MHGQREVPQGYQQRLPAGDIIEEPSAPGYGESMKRYDSLLSRSSSQRVIVKQPVQKFVLEPGTPCQPLEQILSTTKTTENGVTTYLISKALSGVMLEMASQAPPPPSTVPKKQQIPELTEPVGAELEPHMSGYAAITHEGCYRQYNQDKVSIILEEDVKWFGVYDGHGGDKCSQFLKEHLHKTFFQNKRWRQDIKQALLDAFQHVEQQWLRLGDASGSCCLVVVVYQETCYVANLGDSRAILASEGAKKVYQITKDHKPSNLFEQKRVMEAGGKIYQTTAISSAGGRHDSFVGPLRVYPGRLSTTRTFGDCQAKDPKNGGNPNVVISQPEITSFSISEHDMIILASDGLWDRIDNREALRIVKATLTSESTPLDLCKRGATELLREAMIRGSTDNISVVVVGLPELSELTNPTLKMEATGSEHIKVLSSISSATDNRVQKKKRDPTEHNKQNENNPSKLKALDSRINEIARSADKLLVNPR